MAKTAKKYVCKQNVNLTHPDTKKAVRVRVGDVLECEKALSSAFGKGMKVEEFFDPVAEKASDGQSQPR